MTDIISLLIYFIAGVVQDFFLTMNWRYVAKEKVFLSVLFSFFAVLIAMTVLYEIVKNLDPQKSILAIIVYSLGVAAGTYVAMKAKLKK